MESLFLADAQAFINHPLAANAKPPQNLFLDLAVLTALPPDLHEFKKIMASATWLRNHHLADNGPVIYNQRHRRVDIYYNLQHPPSKLDRHHDIALDLKIFVDNNFVSTTIAYNQDNEYGGGCLEQGKLKQKGREFVLVAWSVGLKIDLAHASRQTALDIIKLAEEIGANGMIINSHTACADIYNHCRNSDDEILSGLSDLGGYVGLSTVTFMLDAEDNSTTPFLRHLEHLLEIVDEDLIVIGSDAPYASLPTAIWKKKTQEMIEKLGPDIRLKIRWPDYIPELIRPDKLNYLYELLEVNFGQELAKKICGQNLLACLKPICCPGERVA